MSSVGVHPQAFSLLSIPPPAGEVFERRGNSALLPPALRRGALLPRNTLNGRRSRHFRIAKAPLEATARRVTSNALKSRPGETPPIVPKLIDFLDDTINLLAPRSSSLNGQDPLQGNFAPVTEELHKPNLRVISGELPADLNGAFIRNGPNPKLKPTNGYLWIDGDGMLHAVRVKGGKATYSNHLIQTNRVLGELQAGRAFNVKVGDMFGVPGLLRVMLDKWRRHIGLVDPESSQNGNISIVFHAGQLMALNENDLPYIIELHNNGSLRTVGLERFQGRLTHSFTAHPKIDPQTGEMFIIGYDMEKAPYLHYSVINADGRLRHSVPITLPRPVVMHDFGITERYALFLDLPFTFSLADMVKNGKLPIQWQPQHGARLGVLPRYAADDSQIKWIPFPTKYLFHVANSWEEGDDIIKIVGYPTPEMDLANADISQPRMVLYTVELSTGRVTEQQLSPDRADMPAINRSKLGRRSRYIYSAVFEPIGFKIVGVMKMDMDRAPGVNVPCVGDAGSAAAAGCEVGRVIFGPGCNNSEAAFVPRAGAEEEDDGYLVLYMHNDKTNKSKFVVLDAKTMSPTPLAEVELPQRVPYGFHGTFLTEDEIMAQKVLLQA
eukprot:jgi/Mesvir1/25546/Mv01788-RA.1